MEILQLPEEIEVKGTTTGQVVKALKIERDQPNPDNYGIVQIAEEPDLTPEQKKTALLREKRMMAKISKDIVALKMPPVIHRGALYLAVSTSLFREAVWVPSLELRNFAVQRFL